MKLPERRTAVLLALLVALGAAAALLLERQRNPARVAISRAFPFEAGDSSRFRAFVLVSAEDCAGNLGFLDLFERDTTRVRLSRLYLVGPPSALDFTAALLRGRDVHTPLLPASPAIQRAMIQLGASGTPFLIILDRDGTVRLAMTSPPDIDTYVRLPKLFDELWAQGIYDPLVIR